MTVTGNRTSPGATQANCMPQIQSPCPGGDGGQGGGIANFGTLTIDDSAITANSTGAGASGKRGSPGFVGGSFGGTAGTSGSGGNGGGIDNFQTLTITNSTIAGNTTGAGATVRMGETQRAATTPASRTSAGFPAPAATWLEGRDLQRIRSSALDLGQHDQRQRDRIGRGRRQRR